MTRRELVFARGRFRSFFVSFPTIFHVKNVKEVGGNYVQPFCF